MYTLNNQEICAVSGGLRAGGGWVRLRDAVEDGVIDWAATKIVDGIEWVLEKIF